MPSPVLSATCILPAAAVLAEGPVWHDRRLWWVDIEQREIHRFDPSADSDQAWVLPGRVGFIVPARRGGFVVGTEHGLSWFEESRGALPAFAHPEAGRPELRFNDAKCDAAGRLWAGTMSIREDPGLGSLYRIDAEGAVTRMIPRVSVSNGLAWSPDGRTLYYVDSPTRQVDAFDFIPETGELRHRRTVVRVVGAFPDGICTDAKGRLWVALWGGWCVACFDPTNGELIQRVGLPVEAVTSCCFGDGDELFITTARRDLDAVGRREEPLAGGIFRARVDVHGLPVGSYAGRMDR